MIGPVIGTGIEQFFNSVSDRINAREIRALVQIAVLAGQRQISKLRLSTMLARTDVFDVKQSKGQLFLI